MKKSILEESFRMNFQEKLERAGLGFQTQAKAKDLFPGKKVPAYKYDVALLGPVGKRRVLIELDGNGYGHSSVKNKARDAHKGNLAIMHGYEFYRLTTKHFQRGLPTNYVHELVDFICGG